MSAFLNGLLTNLCVTPIRYAVASALLLTVSAPESSTLYLDVEIADQCLHDTAVRLSGIPVRSSDILDFFLAKSATREIDDLAALAVASRLRVEIRDRLAPQEQDHALPWDRQSLAIVLSSGGPQYSDESLANWRSDLLVQVEDAINVLNGDCENVASWREAAKFAAGYDDSEILFSMRSLLLEDDLSNQQVAAALRADQMLPDIRAAVALVGKRAIEPSEREISDFVKETDPWNQMKDRFDLDESMKVFFADSPPAHLQKAHARATLTWWASLEIISNEDRRLLHEEEITFCCKELREAVLRQLLD